MTVPESTPTPTASNHRTGSPGRQNIGGHILAENGSSRLVNEHTLAEIPSRQQSKRQFGHPDRWQRAHLAKERNAYPEEGPHAYPAIRDNCTERRADVECTYKCTDLEDDQCDCKSTGEMMRRSSVFDLYWMSALYLPKQFQTRPNMMSEHTK